MWSSLSSWLGLAGLGASLAGVAALIAGLSWIPGVGTVLSLATSALQMAAPLINGVLAAIVWIWGAVLWPGLLDILDSWATIFTVLIMGAFLWFGLAARYEVQHVKDRHAISKCITPQQDQDTEVDLPWPFKWK